MPSDRLDHIVRLDGLRGIACLLVIAGHWYKGVIGVALSSTGVRIFFVLSGFLITRLLLVESRSMQGWWRFFVRRASRIFPLYYAVLVLGYLYYGNNLWVEALYIGNYVTTTPQFGHVWSLAVEEQFYLVWPFLVLFWWRAHLGKVIAGLVLLSLFWMVVTTSRLGYDWGTIYAQTEFNVALLGAGSLVALFERRVRGSHLLALVLTVVPAAGGYLLWSLAPGFATTEYQANICGTHAFLLALAFSCFVLGLWGFGRWVLEFPLLVHIGRISYGMYLLHMSVLGELANTWIGELAGIPVLFFVSHLSFRYFERPVMQAIRRRGLARDRREASAWIDPAGTAGTGAP